MLESIQYLEIYLHYLLLFFTLVVFVSFVYLTYINMPEKEDITNRWLLLPAISMNKAFNNIFGYSDGTIKTLLTFKSIFMILLISIIANILCVSLILSNIPEDLTLDFQSIKLFTLSYFTFLFFNFLGDLTSISFTRHVLYKVAENKMRLRKYILKDFFGIVLGYMVTLFPIIILIIFNTLNVNLEIINSLKEHGALGPIYIPFSLLVFATTHIVPSVFMIFALIAILSVALPTFLFVLTVLLIQLISIVNLNFTIKSFLDLLIKFSNKILLTIGFILIIIYLLKEVWLK